MHFQKYRPFALFIVIVFLFVSNVIFVVYLVVTWDRDPNSAKNSVEVSLPVIDWQSYSRLSKKMGNDNIDPSQ